MGDDDAPALAAFGCARRLSADDAQLVNRARDVTVIWIEGSLLVFAWVDDQWQFLPSQLGFPR